MRLRTTLRGGRNTPPSGGSAYAWYPALDLNTIPFHTGSGVWGPQRAIVAPSAPVTTTDVTVTTAAELQAQIYTPGRRITVNGIIDGGLVFNSGNITDIDIIVPPGSRLGTPYFGNFSVARTITRLRLRGPTIGTYSGGQIHQMDWADLATGSDVIIDGLAMTGDVGTCAVSRIPVSRIAVVNCIISSGCYAVSTTGTDMVMAGCTILRGQNLSLQGTGDEEAYGWRMNRECQGYQIMYGCDMRSTPTRDESSHASVRCHPNPGLDYVYVANNRIVERVENWVFVCDAAMGSGTSIARGVWFLNNECITDGTGTGALANTTPKLYGSSTEYAYCQNNTFKSTGFTSDSNINLTGTVNGAAGKSGNVYQSLISDPTWYSPGDPSTIDYSP